MEAFEFGNDNAGRRKLQGQIRREQMCITYTRAAINKLKCTVIPMAKAAVVE